MQAQTHASTQNSPLTAAVARIVATVAPSAVILFGSTARGTADPDSDLDLLVVEDLSPQSGRTRAGELKRLRRALWDIPVAIDLLVFSPEEFARWRDSRTHVLGVAAREGMLVHGQI